MEHRKSPHRQLDGSKRGEAWLEKRKALIEAANAKKEQEKLGELTEHHTFQPHRISKGGSLASPPSGGETSGAGANRGSTLRIRSNGCRNPVASLRSAATRAVSPTERSLVASARASGARAASPADRSPLLSARGAASPSDRRPCLAAAAKAAASAGAPTVPAAPTAPLAASFTATAGQAALAEANADYAATPAQPSGPLIKCTDLVNAPAQPMMPIQFSATQCEKGCGSSPSDTEPSIIMVAPGGPAHAPPRAWDDPLQEWTEAELLAEVERRGLRIPANWLHFNAAGTYCVVERPPRGFQFDGPPSPCRRPASPTLGGG